MKDYKEALKDIVNIINTTEKSDIGFVNICSYLDANCPELMKNEDDRIKENIIATIHLFYGEPLEDEAKEMIAWLEKQGNKDKLIQELGEYKVKYIQKVLGEHLNDISHKDDESLEKQGKKKSQRMISAAAKEALFDVNDDIQQEDSASKTESDFLFKAKYAGREYKVKELGGTVFYGIEDEPNHIDFVKAENCKIVSGYAIKENGSPYPIKPITFSEQESDDKVKRKFKVGDWVIRKDGQPFDNHNSKIAQIRNIDSKGRHWFDCGTWDEAKEIRLWTIQDAKDGDILTSSSTNSTFIYNGRFDNIYVGAHGGVSVGINDKFIIAYGQPLYYFWTAKQDVRPATKKETEHLFNCMTEAGYKWDADKKELIEL